MVLEITDTQKLNMKWRKWVKIYGITKHQEYFQIVNGWIDDWIMVISMQIQLPVQVKSDTCRIQLVPWFARASHK